MEVNEIVAELRRMQVKIGSLTCLSCDHCGVRGCAILREAADALERLNDFDQTQSKKMLEKLQKAQEELDEMKRSGWIGVKDRLPKQTDPGTKVIFITEKSGVYVGCYYESDACHKFDGWYSAFARIENVTHWMPLPEPPKEDEA